MRAPDLGQRRVALEEVLQRDGRGEVALRDEFRGRLVNSSVYGIEEMRRLQEARNPVIGLIVDEHGAEQGLLRIDVMRGHSVFGGGALVMRMSVGHLGIGGGVVVHGHKF